MSGPAKWLGRAGVFYLFALPFAAITIVFGLWPIILSIDVSLTKSATALRAEPTYVGFANYLKIFADPVFLASLWRTLLYTLFAVVANVSFALAYALLLNSSAIGFGKTFFKVVMFLPVVTPDIAGYVVWRWLYDQSFGAVNAFLLMAGFARVRRTCIPVNSYTIDTDSGAVAPRRFLRGHLSGQSCHL